ncbi:MAG TPA: wax ester/triacylglycerol synthase family O-acyltransferase [Casimicrobiaceae bacterium]|nr:wax ester/triacylglycerol synthase family O-acyltransferase [Casimicrobiaceae bacterium]
MPATTREKISAVDTAWLRMDRPQNLMMICGVLLFRERVAHSRLRALVEERFLVFPRFRQRALQMPGFCVWETDREFDLNDHVVRARLPGKGDRDALEALVSRLIASPLDAARPMWQFHLVENFDGGSALVARIHHCYADGMALVRVMLSMTDRSAQGPAAMPFERKHRNEQSSPFDALLQPLNGVMKAAKRIGATIVERGAGIWQHPAQAIELANQGSLLTGEAARLALMGEDSRTRFKGRVNIAKRVAWADPLNLDEVKTVGKALQATVNDVLLSCVAGALRSYLVAKGDAVDDVHMRALVPINLRPLEKAYKLGNRFGLVFLDLPIGIENPVERLYAVRANMNALKGSYQPLLAMGILAAMGAGPRLLQDGILNVLSKNASAVMTNVPGPREPLYLAGARIDGLMFWVPQSGDIGMGVSIISYAGEVRFGLVTDRGLCPDPERVIDRFAHEFEMLLLTTLLSPWPREGELDPEQAAAAVAKFG